MIAETVMTPAFPPPPLPPPTVESVAEQVTLPSEPALTILMSIVFPFPPAALVGTPPSAVIEPETFRSPEGVVLAASIRSDTAPAAPPMLETPSDPPELTIRPPNVRSPPD
jgi:hypothetical protein